MFETESHFENDENGGLIFVEGTLLELESIESAIDALARDEVRQAEEARYHAHKDAGLGS